LLARLLREPEQRLSAYLAVPVLAREGDERLERGGHGALRERERRLPPELRVGVLLQERVDALEAFLAAPGADPERRGLPRLDALAAVEEAVERLRRGGSGRQRDRREGLLVAARRERLEERDALGRRHAVEEDGVLLPRVDRARRRERARV